MGNEIDHWTEPDRGRFFGSGVILATAIVHLLDPAIQQIGLVNTYAHGGCLSNGWGAYPYPVSPSPTTRPPIPTRGICGNLNVRADTMKKAWHLHRSPFLHFCD